MRIRSYREWTRWRTNSVYQGYQVRAVLVGDGGELQAQAAVGNHILNYCFGADLSFGNKKIHPRSCAQGPRSRCREE